MGIGSFPGVKSGRGVTPTPHPLLVPWSWKGRAIPLLPLWAVRPSQSLSACTRVHFTYPVQRCRFCIVNSTTFCYEVCVCVWLDELGHVTLNGEIVGMAGKSIIFLFFQSRSNERYRMAYLEWRHNYSARQWFLSLLLSFPLVWKRTLPASFNVNAKSSKRASYNLWSWLF
jgi:hypothetical protein